MASSFPEKRVFTSEIANATALGAATITVNAIYQDDLKVPDLGLSEIKL